MDTARLLKLSADAAFSQIQGAIADVGEPLAWGTLPPTSDEYLHTDGSISGIVLHVAGCKIMYGSVAFRESEVRWKDLAEKIDRFEPSWPAAQAFLLDAHNYWMSCWDQIESADLEGKVKHFSGELWPTWKIVQTVTHHDEYHAGQIAVMKFAAEGTTTHPASAAADIREHCSMLPDW